MTRWFLCARVESSRYRTNSIRIAELKTKGGYHTYFSTTALHRRSGTMISSTDLDQLLAYYPALHELPSRLYRSLQLQPQAISFPAGRTLFDVGDMCHFFLAIAAVSVRVVKPGNTGYEI